MQNTDDSQRVASSLVLNGAFNEKKQSKKHRTSDHGDNEESSRGSASSQGSRNGTLVVRTSSSSEEEEKPQPRVKKNKRSTKKPQTRHHLIEDEDDERTDSADEGDKPFSTSFTQSNSYTQPVLRPLSPTMMSVGYGADLRTTHTPTHKEGVIDITSSTTMESSQVPPCDPISPEVEGDTTSSVLPLASNNMPTATSVLPSPIPNTLPFAGWYPSMYSPFCGGGSVATTPATLAGENGSFIAPGTVPPGTTVAPGTTCLLHATIYNESEGILIVNVRWRNKSFSGSLIDLNGHQWAPPKLAEGFSDLQIQVKDLYKKQESEKEVVDIDGDTGCKDRESESDKAMMEISVTKEDPPSKGDTPDIGGDTNDETCEKKVKTSLVDSKQGKVNPSIALPSFDAVKSPQPEFRRDGTKTTKEEIPTSPVEQSQQKPPNSKPQSTLAVTYTSTEEEARPSDHHNLNTLVDVATKMKPVTDQGKADSSSLSPNSPERKKAIIEKTQEGGKGPLPKPSDAPTLGPQLFSVPMSPLSPADGSRKKVTKPQFPLDHMRPPNPEHFRVPPHSDHLGLHDQLRVPHPPDQLKAQWDNKPPIPSIVAQQQGDGYHQAPSAPSVIQGSSDKGKPRKRKLLPQNETNKRVSPPVKDGIPFVRDKMIPPLPISYTSSTKHDTSNTQQHHNETHAPPPGFIFDPSLPMPYDYQVISYKEQLKSSEEASGDDHTVSKIIKRPKTEATHDTLPVAKTTARSPSPNLRRHTFLPPPLSHDQRIFAIHGHGNNPHGSNPHGNNPHGNNPHGNNPHGSNPHGNNLHGSKPERPPSKDSHKPHKKHLIQRKPDYPPHIKKDPDGPPHQTLFMSPQGMFGVPQGLQSSAAPSPHWPVAIPQTKPIKTDPEHHSSTHRSTPSPHPSVSKKPQDWNKPHIVDNKPHIHHSTKHESRHHPPPSTSTNTLSQVSPTNSLRSNGTVMPQVVPEEWLKQMQLLELQNAGATPTIPMAAAALQPQLNMWETQLMQLMSAGRGDQALQLQQQLALQQQQMIQGVQGDTTMAFASPGMVPFMSIPGFTGMVPYALPPTQQKRDS